MKFCFPPMMPLWLVLAAAVGSAVAAPAPVASASAPTAKTSPVVKPPAKPVPAVPGAAKAAPLSQAPPKPVVSKPPVKPAAAKPAAPAQPVVLIQTPQAFCQQAASRLPNVPMALCAQAQLQANGARSVKGHALMQRDVVSPNAHLRVLVIGGIHGDELSSTSLVLHWIRAAGETPSNIHWRFVPLLNPDAMLQASPTRTNAHGVDLNRNFPTPHWDKEAPQYWSKRTKNDPRRYPGPKPLSEPESRWLYEEMERWKPNLIVSVHAPYGVLDFDGPTSPPQKLGRLYLDQVGIFPGSLGNYGGVHKKMPVVTIELPSAIRTPQEAEIRQMWLDLLRWSADRLGAN